MLFCFCNNTVVLNVEIIQRDLSSEHLSSRLSGFVCVQIHRYPISFVSTVQINFGRLLTPLFTKEYEYSDNTSSVNGMQFLSDVFLSFRHITVSMTNLVTFGQGRYCILQHRICSVTTAKRELVEIRDLNDSRCFSPYRNTFGGVFMVFLRFMAPYQIMYC